MLFNLIKKVLIICFVIISSFCFTLTTKADDLLSKAEFNESLHHDVYLRDAQIAPSIYPSNFNDSNCTEEEKDKSYKIDRYIHKNISGSELIEYELYAPESCKQLLSYRKEVLKEMLKQSS